MAINDVCDTTGNWYGQLGLGNILNKNTPTQVKGLLEGKEVKSIKVGNYHSIALTADGEIFSWGSNIRGQLGTGDTIHKNSPVKVMGQLDGKMVAFVYAGGYYSIALTSENETYCWGGNHNGQLKLPHNNDEYLPTCQTKHQRRD